MSDWKKMIQDAKELLDMGAITQEQFEQVRNDALANRGESTTPPPSTPNLDDIGTSIQTGGVTPTAPPSDLDGMGTFVGKMDGDVVGSHKIIELLGEGGMGSVYRGRHTIEAFAEAEGDVAIKMILPSLAKDEAFKNRFIREASLGKKLNHPNIAKVVSIHSSDDVLALVMEYIEGKELKDLIPEGGMSVDEVVQLLKPIASALDYLHKEGIVHRDMKPANVRVKPDGTPVILDFGIAKDTNEVDSNMTQTGTAMGTQTYMAPEQMDAKRVTGAADQYALAMMAYQMLSGKLPWDSGVSQARLGMIKITSDYQTLIAICSVSKPQNNVVMKGLSLQPEDRYETCVVFVETLDSAPSVEQLKREAEVERLAEQERLRARQEAERLEQERLAKEARLAEEAKLAEKARLAKERQKQKQLEAERQRKADQERQLREEEQRTEERRREVERQRKANHLEEKKRDAKSAKEGETLTPSSNRHTNRGSGLYTNLYVHSHVGGRDNNQDFGKAFRLNNFDVLIVCDGMGGHDDGDWASETAVNILEKQLEKLDAQSNLQFDGDFLDKIEDAIQLANKTIYTKSQRLGRVIGTTFTMAIAWKGPGPKYFWIGWCGDSKIYMLNNSNLEKIYISKDHNHQRAVSTTDPHTPLERPDSLSRAIGVQQQVDYDYLIFELDDEGLYYVAEDGTHEPVAELSSVLLLLCSDGLTSVFEQDVFPYEPEILDAEDERILSKIKTSIVQNASPQQVVDTLIDVALQRRTEDNVTVGILTLSLTERVSVFASTSLFGGGVAPVASETSTQDQFQDSWEWKDEYNDETVVEAKHPEEPSFFKWVGAACLVLLCVLGYGLLSDKDVDQAVPDDQVVVKEVAKPKMKSSDAPKPKKSKIDDNIERPQYKGKPSGPDALEHLSKSTISNEPQPKSKTTPKPIPKKPKTEPKPKPKTDPQEDNGWGEVESGGWGASACSVQVNSNVSSAKVYIDGVPKGSVGKSLSVDCGYHKLEVRSEGYKSVTRSIDLISDASFTIELSQ